MLKTSTTFRGIGRLAVILIVVLAAGISAWGQAASAPRAGEKNNAEPAKQTSSDPGQLKTTDARSPTTSPTTTRATSQIASQTTPPASAPTAAQATDPATAQPATKSPASTTPQKTTNAKPGKPKRGQLVVAPIPISSPAVGSGLVLAAGYVFKLNQNDKLSPPSVVGLVGAFTSSGSRGGGIGGRLYFSENKYQTTFALAKGRVNFDFFGIGRIPGRDPISVPLKMGGTVFFGEFMRNVGQRHFCGAALSTPQSLRQARRPTDAGRFRDSTDRHPIRLGRAWHPRATRQARQHFLSDERFPARRDRRLFCHGTRQQAPLSNLQSLLPALSHVGAQDRSSLIAA